MFAHNFVVVVTNKNQLSVRVSHLIYGAWSVPDPLPRIGVVPICRGVIVPSSDLQNRAAGEYRSIVRIVDVVNVPVVTKPVGVVEEFSASVWINGF